MNDVMYAMQRANGEWFTTEIEGRLCLPVFRNFTAAQRVHARIADLMVYLPQPLDSVTLETLKRSRNDIGFWLVDEFDPNAELTPGHWLTESELVVIGEDGDYAISA